MVTDELQSIYDAIVASLHIPPPEKWPRGSFTTEFLTAPLPETAQTQEEVDAVCDALAALDISTVEARNRRGK